MRTATILVLSILSARAVSAADQSKPGELITEPATLISLGFEWRIEGDDNRNARVEVSYRKQGEQAWKAGPPLLRIGNERINGDFAGKAPDLGAYEVGQPVPHYGPRP